MPPSQYHLFLPLHDSPTVEGATSILATSMQVKVAEAREASGGELPAALRAAVADNERLNKQLHVLHGNAAQLRQAIADARSLQMHLQQEAADAREQCAALMASLAITHRPADFQCIGGHLMLFCTAVALSCATAVVIIRSPVPDMHTCSSSPAKGCCQLHLFLCVLLGSSLWRQYIALLSHRAQSAPAHTC